MTRLLSWMTQSVQMHLHGALSRTLYTSNNALIAEITSVQPTSSPLNYVGEEYCS